MLLADATLAINVVGVGKKSSIVTTPSLVFHRSGDCFADYFAASVAAAIWLPIAGLVGTPELSAIANFDASFECCYFAELVVDYCYYCVFDSRT